jgi:hypothetical protein
MQNQVAISPSLARTAERFSIDLSARADSVLLADILGEVAVASTPRMQIALLAARQLARDYGHQHVGCEHVFLAILLDQHSLPAQLLATMGNRDDLIERTRSLLGSESYNRAINNEDGGASNG